MSTEQSKRDELTLPFADNKIVEHDGFVYLIKHPDGFYKIGKSNNPAKRKKSLAAGTPYKLKIDYLINTKNPDRVEDNLHDILEEYQHKREWFNISHSVLMQIITQDSMVASTNNIVIYEKNKYESLFKPPKRGVIQKGQKLILNYKNQGGSPCYKMVEVVDVELDFDDSFKINALNITLQPEELKEIQLIQKRSDDLKIKRFTNKGSLRHVSDDVTIISFNEVNYKEIVK